MEKEKKNDNYKRKTILNAICAILWAASAFLYIRSGKQLGYVYMFLCCFFISVTLANYRKYKKQKIENEKEL